MCIVLLLKHFTMPILQILNLSEFDLFIIDKYNQVWRNFNSIHLTSISDEVYRSVFANTRELVRPCMLFENMEITTKTQAHS